MISLREAGEECSKAPTFFARLRLDHNFPKEVSPRCPFPFPVPLLSPAEQGGPFLSPRRPPFATQRVRP